MPKRKTVEYYEEKIRRLQEKPKKRRRRIVYSSSDTEANKDIGAYEECIVPATLEPATEQNIGSEAEQANSVEGLTYVPPDLALEPDILPEKPPDSKHKLETPDLAPELLSALGEPAEDIPIFGENIHTSLTQRWLPILKKGLLKEGRTKLINEYPIPENCKLLKAPTLNFEISAAVAEVVRNRDKSIQTKQDQLGHGIASISKTIIILLRGDDKVNAIKVLSDGYRLLIDLHYTETELRTKLITPCLQKSFLSVIENQDRDETLFGVNLSEKIKSSQAIERQGHQIKKSTLFNKTPAQASASSATKTRHSENWQGPPRYPMSSRGGRGGPRRVPLTQYRRMAANAVPPPQTLAAPAPAPRPSTFYPGKRVQRQ